MTTITKEDLERIDNKIAWMNTRDNITVEGLDKLLSSQILKISLVPQIFNSNDKELIAMKNFQRLVYYISYIDEDNVEYPNSAFCLVFKVNLKDSNNIKPDFSNCLVEKESLRYDIFDLDDKDDRKKFNSEKKLCVMLNDEIQEHIRDNPDLTQEELKEVMNNYILMGFNK